MNCQDVKSLLYEVIDNEASPQDLQNVRAHLGQCPSCQSLFAQEQAFHSAMRSTCCKAVESDCACERLKNSICGCLDTADKESTGTRTATQTQPLRTWRYILAAAASLVLIASVGYVWWHVSEHNSEYAPLERLHWAAADHPETFTQANFASAESNVLNDFNYQVQDKVDDFTLIGSKADTLDGIAMQHFIYANNAPKKTIVSVFVAPAETFHTPESLEKAKVMKDGLTYFDHNCRGCHVVYHQAGKAMIITATTDHSVDLFDFVSHRIGI